MKAIDTSAVKGLSLNEFLTIRERLEYSKQTIVCFELEGVAYAVTMHHVARELVKLDQSSRGLKQGRIRLSKKDKLVLRNRKECRKLGAYDTIFDRYVKRITELNDGKTPKQLNKGHAWECWLTEEAGQEWKPDTLSFWLGADLEANGTTYQIKGDGAEYFNETNIANALKWEAEQARA